MKKLSIIVPVYNMAADEKLNFCLDSLLAQKLPAGSFEIIPVDDASTDNSADILRDYQKKNPDVIFPVYSPENRKQGGAKNLGLAAARGEWVGFIDADDWASPDMFPKLLQKAEDTGADVVGCQYSITYEHSFAIGTPELVHDPAFTGPMDDRLRGHFAHYPGSLVVKIYRSDVISANQLCFPEHTFYEDNEAGPIWMLHFKHFALVDEPLYYYYQHSDSTVHTINMDRLHNRMDTASRLIDTAKEKGWLDAYYKDFEGSFIRIYYANTLFSYMQESPRIRMAFLKELQDGMHRYFPDFEKSECFAAEYDAEQRKLMHMHMKNVFLFAFYYKALHLYRRIRYGKRM